MGLPNVMLTGRSGMMAARSAIGTTGHNIANANTEGYNRQRVELETQEPTANQGYKGFIGRGTQIARVSRINDEYLDKQIRNGNRSLQFMEEKDLSLRQTEDIFNEMNGEGLNRLMAKFFNEFRQLANDPNSEAIRQSVREATNAMTSDFKRMRGEVDDVRRHIDNRIEGYTREVNQLADQIANMNQKILQLEIGGGSPNDLLDQRDLAVKKLASYMDVSVHKSKNGSVTINIVGAGPLVTGPKAEQFNVQRSPRDDDGKPENALDIYSSSSANSNVTHVIKGGKLGALVEVRDQTLGTILSRMDDLAFGITESVNAIHRQGLTRDGVTGIDFFKPQTEKFRAAEYFGLSDDILASTNNIATAAQPDSPGDNRIAIAISGIQSMRLMNDGKATMDDWYNSIVSDIGVVTARNRDDLNQQKSIMTQLDKIRDQISNVSIDEETANLLEFQHSFDASAKVIAVADEMLKTVLDLKR